MTNQEINYKQTINLPRTAFPMKADLPQREPRILEFWRRQDVYRRLHDKSNAAPKYILHDGPPYANGNIHIGHALNKILKDIVVKYKNMRGFRAPFVPGWDCHGLPVEHQLFKELGKRKEEVDQAEFRTQAYEFALKFVLIQAEEFKRLGIFGDWDNPYLTMAFGYEAAIIRSFGKLAEKGYVYKGCKPVNWCYQCETALAEAEVEYNPHVSPSIFVKLDVLHPEKIPGGRVSPREKCRIVIWTTTPWTLLGNAACTVHPEFKYALLRSKSKDEVLIIERGLAPAILEKAAYGPVECIGEVKGAALERLEYGHPFGMRTGVVVLGDYVSGEDGSGIVHTAPGYGMEDFLTGKKYDLETVMQVDGRGCFFPDTAEFGGMHVRKADPEIVEKLKQSGRLLWQGEITHSYPHCWRCKKPIIFRATEQWFMSIDHDCLRGRLLKAIPAVAWIPAFGENRIAAMVENRPDWCLSRQRLWGVPVPVFYCAACNTALLEGRVIGHVAGIVEKEGANAWFNRPEEELLPPGIRCGSCGHTRFRREKDILDVWFDSGVSAQAVLKTDAQLQYPADLYLEGSDQHRGWFQASLIPAVAIDGCPPFKTVLTHGFVVDGEGKKMSKSLGNVVAPQEVIAKLGADVLRLWAASADYNDDMRISGEILARVSENYRKIRNTLKFILGNLYDFDPEKHALAHERLWEIDRWALSRTHRLLKQATESYDTFVFYQVNKFIYNFCVVDMSSFYLDVLKDRLYTYAAASAARRSAQTALYEILSVMIPLLAPVLSFTAEEAYACFPGRKHENGVFFLSWPEARDSFINPELEKNWQVLSDVRTAVLKALEEARGRRIIGNSLDAKVIIGCPREPVLLSEILGHYRRELAAVFIVSQAEIKSFVDMPAGALYNITFPKEIAAGQTAAVRINIERAEGEKCVRCWNYSRGVGSNQAHPGLCVRCAEQIGFGKEKQP